MEEIQTKKTNTRKDDTKVLFKSPILEKLSRTHISFPIGFFIIYSTGLLLYSISYTNLGVGVTIGSFLLGVLAFTLIEYLSHRYIFHINTSSEKRKKFQYTIHGVHHEYPKDKTRLALPPLLSISISTSLLFILRMVIGDYTFVFLPGFLMGYSAYLFVHYIVHAYQPPKNFFKTLWIYHGIHHYKSPNKAFGVSSPLWDYIFRTLP